MFLKISFKVKKMRFLCRAFPLIIYDGEPGRSPGDPPAACFRNGLWSSVNDGIDANKPPAPLPPDNAAALRAAAFAACICMAENPWRLAAKLGKMEGCGWWWPGWWGWCGGKWGGGNPGGPPAPPPWAGLGSGPNPKPETGIGIVAWPNPGNPPAPGKEENKGWLRECKGWCWLKGECSLLLFKLMLLLQLVGEGKLVCELLEEGGGGGLLVPRLKSLSEPSSDGIGDCGGVLSSSSSVSVLSGRLPTKPRWCCNLCKKEIPFSLQHTYAHNEKMINIDFFQKWKKSLFQRLLSSSQVCLAQLNNTLFLAIIA